MSRSRSGDRVLAHRIGELFEQLALLLLLGAVCLLPWWLGGVIPFARVLVTVCSSASLALIVVSVIISRRRLSIPPMGFWLLLGYAAIGVVQMLPLLNPATGEMRSAVFPANIVNDSSAPRSIPDPAVSPFRGRSVAPSFTRFHVAQWISAALIFCAAFDLLRTKRRILGCLVALVVNACFVTFVALLQSFGDGEMLIGAFWMRNTAKPFGPFVNPNNAAGWLCVHLAIAIGLMILVWGRDAYAESGRRRQQALQEHFRIALTYWTSRLARLNAQHILAAFSIVLLLLGVAATLSRGGICAAIICVSAAVLAQWQWKKVALFGLPMVLICGLALGSLVLFDLDQDVFKELRTLKDPVSESTGRLLHWTDSLQVVRDFPGLGAGLGTYRFCTLPYQRRWVGSWFVNADNQFLEIFIEAGFLGLSLIFLFGGKILFDSIRLLRFSRSRSSKNGLSANDYRAVGVMGFAIVPSQAFAMLFDFGAGLPATVAVVSFLAGTTAGLKLLASASNDSGGQESGMATQTVFAMVIRVCCVVTAFLGSSDLISSHRIYAVIAESERAIANPVSRSQLDRASELSASLRQLLAERPDDIEGMWTQVRLQESLFRLKLIDSLAETPPDDKVLQTLWEQLSPIGLACHLQALRSGTDIISREEVDRRFREALLENNWLQDAAALRTLNPLVPGIMADEIAAEYCVTGRVPDQKRIQQLLFAEPAGARRLFWIGHISQFAGNLDVAQQCWQQCLESSEVFRAIILSEAWTQMASAECLSIYAPRNYEDSVQVLDQVTDAALRKSLLQLCDQQWNQLDGADLSGRQRLQRARHLKILDSDSAILWIDECLSVFPEELELRRMRAELLEQSGRFSDAIGEWLRIQHYNPDEAAVDGALRRLSEKL
jgi:tetratricopeptide (TPR) repeat protein